MAVSPVNFLSSYGLVPIFEWVAVQTPGSSTAEGAPAPTCDGGDGTQQPADTDTTATEMRLVFKGFEWRATFGVATFPRPDWMAGLASGAADPTDPSNKHDDRNSKEDDAARARKAALLAHHQPDLAAPDDTPTQEPSE